jgi:cobalt-zinc-cadmium efflux system outer membrane protein
MRATGRGIVALIAVVLAGRAGGEEALDMERAVALALERSADVAAHDAEVGAARARLDEAQLVFHANPELAVAAGPRVRSGETTVDLEVALSQQIEVFGVRGARIEVARAERDAAEAALAARKVEVAALVRQSFARALASERLRSLSQEDLALARESVRVAERRQSLGDASQLEVNAARVEVGRVLREAHVAERASSLAMAELRLALGLEPTVPIQLLDVPARTRSAVDVDRVVSRALEKRADLRAARHELEAARADDRRASREWLPAPRVGATYKREEKADVVLGSIEVPIPLFNHNQGGRGTAAARLTKAERTLEAAERRARQEIMVAARRAEAAREAVRAFEADIVAASQDNLLLTTKAYESGKLRLPELLLVRRSAIEARRGHIEALEELSAAEAELRRATGMDAEPLQGS